MPLETPFIGAEMMTGSFVLGNHSCSLFFAGWTCLSGDILFLVVDIDAFGGDDDVFIVVVRGIVIVGLISGKCLESC